MAGLSSRWPTAPSPLACNSRGQETVAQTCPITYLRPVRAGERLVASGREVAAAGRSGLYDVTVAGEGGLAVAEFRGQSRQVGARVPA